MKKIQPNRRLAAMSLSMGLVHLTVSPSSLGEPGKVETWTGFRGPGNSLYPSETMPGPWTQDSIAWKSKFQGTGQSSPVIWGDRVFVTSLEGPNKEKLLVHCVNLKDGQTVVLKTEDTPVVDFTSELELDDKDRVYGYAVAEGRLIFRLENSLVCVSGI